MCNSHLGNRSLLEVATNSRVPPKSDFYSSPLLIVFTSGGLPVASIYRTPGKYRNILGL